MLDQVEHVRAKEAVTPGQHENGIGAAEAGDLIDHIETLGSGELTGQGSLGGTGPAVLAGQQASAGDLPEDEHRSLPEVQPNLGRFRREISHDVISFRGRASARASGTS